MIQLKGFMMCSGEFTLYCQWARTFVHPSSIIHWPWFLLWCIQSMLLLFPLSCELQQVERQLRLRLICENSAILTYWSWSSLSVKQAALIWKWYVEMKRMYRFNSAHWAWKLCLVPCNTFLIIVRRQPTWSWANVLYYISGLNSNVF